MNADDTVLMRYRLQEGPKVKVYVNENGSNVLISSVPKALLIYFAPKLAQLEQAPKDELQTVVLRKTNQKAAAWILKWMCMGGNQTTLMPPASSQEICVDSLFRRLEVVLYLGIEGQLRAGLIKDLQHLWGKIPASFGECVYKAYTLPSSTTAMRSILVTAVIDSVLACNMVVPSTCLNKHGDAHDAFRLDLMEEMANSAVTGRIHNLQKTAPLSTNQIHFVYLFTMHQSSLRQTVVKDLLVLIKKMTMKDELIYRQYAKTNVLFMNDMRKEFTANHQCVGEKIEPNKAVKSNQKQVKRPIVIKTRKEVKDKSPMVAAKQSKATEIPKAVEKSTVVKTPKEFEIPKATRKSNVNENSSLSKTFNAVEVSKPAEKSISKVFQESKATEKPNATERLAFEKVTAAQILNVSTISKTIEKSKAFEIPKVTENSKATDNQIVVQKPKVVEKSKAVATSQVVEKPKVLEKSKENEELTASKKPKVAEIPAVEIPKAVEKQKTAEKPKASDIPKAAEKSQLAKVLKTMAVKSPNAFQKLKAAEGSISTEMPKAGKQLKADEQPEALEKLKATQIAKAPQISTTAVTSKSPEKPKAPEKPSALSIPKALQKLTAPAKLTAVAKPSAAEVLKGAKVPNAAEPINAPAKPVATENPKGAQDSMVELKPISSIILAQANEFYLTPLKHFNQATRKMALRNAAKEKAAKEAADKEKMVVTIPMASSISTTPTPSMPINKKAKTPPPPAWAVPAATPKKGKNTAKATTAAPLPKVMSTQLGQQVGKREKRLQQRAAKMAEAGSGPTKVSVDKNNVFRILESTSC